MKWILFSILVLCHLFIACTSESNTPTKPKISQTKTALTAYPLFIATTQNIKISSQIYQLDTLFPAQLFLHQNCLSIRFLNDSKSELTYILAKHEKSIFNDQKNLIGIEDIKAQKNYFLGQQILLNGVNTATVNQNPGHPIPKQCFQKYYLGGNILKQ